MKLLEMYTNKTGGHKFVCVEGLRRTDLPFTNSDTDAMLTEAVRIIESDPSFEERIRIYDAHGIALKGSVTMWVTLTRLKSWMRKDQEPLAA